MILIKTVLRPSVIHGIGVFAEAMLPKGSKIWQFMAPYDAIVSAEEIRALPDPIRETVFNYAFKSPIFNYYIYSGDNSRFMNHTTDPNCYDDFEKNAIFTLRDIAAGEELTCDYRAYQEDDDILQFGFIE